MWTDERVEQLKQFWGGGMTAAQIAERIGGVSRNAVIGKAHRMGLSVSKAPSSRAANPSPAKPSPAKPAAVAAPPPPPTPAPQPKRAPDFRVEDLPWHRRCQWPIGHPGERDFHFCGDAAAEGKPYCSEHCVQAYRQKEAAA